MTRKDTAKPTQKKELVSWIFDVCYLAGLIWWFSIPGNTELVWSKIGDYGTRAATKVVSLLPRTKAPAPPANTASLPAPPMFIPPPIPKKEDLETQVIGDSFPAEVTTEQEAMLAPEKPTPKTASVPKNWWKPSKQPVQVAKKKLRGVPFYQVTVDLRDPQTYLVMRLSRGGSQNFRAADETFDSFVKRYPAAVIINGTFFSKDDEKRVMGNMQSEGQTLKYSQWENAGTTLALSESNYPEMITARDDGKPDFKSQWFSLTCGPRLLRGGNVSVSAESEGFRDPHVLGCGPRSAIGFPASRDKLYLVVFLRGLTLEEEAKMMQAIGCVEAMNIDGGASKALSHNGTIVMKPGRPLTNVLVVYDSAHKPPSDIKLAFDEYRKPAESP